MERNVTATRTVKQILSDPHRRWKGAAPASEVEIRSLENVLGISLPSEYGELLRLNNGGEGELALAPLRFQLFEVRWAITLASDEFYKAQFPDILFFGGNGGLESIGFDMREKHQPWPIVAIDCIAGLDSLVTISANISDFIEAIGIGPEERSGE
jgi:SMI1 / KNR4 family (SUKH-1)